MSALYNFERMSHCDIATIDAAGKQTWVQGVIIKIGGNPLLAAQSLSSIAPFLQSKILPPLMAIVAHYLDPTVRVYVNGGHVFWKSRYGSDIAPPFTHVM